MIKLSRGEGSEQFGRSNKRANESSSDDEENSREVREESSQSRSMSTSSTSHQEVYDLDTNRNQSESRKQQDGRDSQWDNSNKPKRNPFCSRCRNHGKSAQVKGHKRHCEYRDCQCGGCKLVECRQIVSAAQIRRRRYQKQDEECGRRIEISPPVLTRASNSDPAALIAESLVNSSTRQTAVAGSEIPLANMKNSLASSILVTPSSLPAAQSLGSQQHLYLHHQPLQAPPDPIITVPTRNIADQQHQSMLNYSHNLGQSTNYNPNNHHHHYHHAHQQTSLASIGSDPRSPTVSTLSNAYQLFNLPDTVISAAKAASLGAHHQSSMVQASGLYAEPNSSANQPPNQSETLAPANHLNFNETLGLVEEIYRIFGPMAIFAWMKTEKFNLERIRSLIESARPAYEDLLEARSNYVLNKNVESENNATKTTGSGLGGTSSGSSSRRSSSNSNIDQQDQEPFVRGQCSTTASSSNVPLTYATSYHKNMVPSATSHNLTTPSSTGGGGGGGSSGGGLQSGYTHQLSQKHCPSNHSAQTNLLWPGHLKLNGIPMPTSGSGVQMMHSLPLLPHFMHHHHQHLLAQHAAKRHHQQQQQQIHDQLSSAAAAAAAAAAASVSATATNTSPVTMNGIAHQMGTTTTVAADP